jgi:EmrB/QacA subfamily drug resistance transporter
MPSDTGTPLATPHRDVGPSPTGAGDHDIDPTTYERRWKILAVLCLSLLIVFVGNSSLNVAIPTLSRVLGATTSQLQWVIAIYSLVFAGLLFSTGALGDRFGRKGALQAGLLVYLGACVAATNSANMWELIACRAAMGVGAALIMPSTLSILVNVFPANERTKAIAIWASVTGAAGAIGPVASGWLLGQFWYGAVFLVNVPILIVALVAGWHLVPKSKDPEQGKLDPVGAALSIVGITSLVYGLIEAPSRGWGDSFTIGAFVLGIAVLAVFVAWELRQSEPMLDIRYFRNPAFSTGTAGMMLVFLAMYGVMFLITQYFQLILGFSPLSSALRFLPMAPIMIVVAPMTPRLAARFGANRVVAAGLSGVGLGLLMFRGLDAHTPYWYVLLAVIPLVSGMALSMSPMTAAIMSAVPSRRAGAGSAMNDATRELGAALGVAVMGSVAASRYSAQINHLQVALPPAARAQARTSLADALGAAHQLPAGVGQKLATGAETAFIDGIHFAVLAGAALAFIAALAVLRYLPRHLEQDMVAVTPAEAAEVTAELGLAGVPPMSEDREPVGAMSTAEALGSDDVDFERIGAGGVRPMSVREMQR